METENRMISAEWLKTRCYEICDEHNTEHLYIDRIIDEIDNAPDVDAVEVVRCEKCLHCVNDEEEHGLCKCVESAEYDSESGLWLGFVEYHTPDFFCAFGERKDND